MEKTILHYLEAENKNELISKVQNLKSLFTYEVKVSIPTFQNGAWVTWFEMPESEVIKMLEKSKTPKEQKQSKKK